MLAGSGYVSEDNFVRADADNNGLRLLAPLANDPDRYHARTPQRARHLDRLPATAHGCCTPAAATTTGFGPAPSNQ